MGAGAKGVVFVGFQERLKRRVAVKLLPKIGVPEKEISLFKSEAEIVAGLSHPHIIPIYEFDSNEELFFQVMHLVEGADLDDMILKRSKHPVPQKRVLPFSTIFTYMIDMLDALDYAHLEGIIHRDIKPANIFIEKRRGRLFVADFGIALSPAVQTAERSGIIMGSPAYLAPEQAKNLPLTGSADIYACGMTFIKMLCGVIPRRKESPEELLRRKIQKPETVLLCSPSQLNSNIDSDLESIIMKMVAPSTDERFSSAVECMDALESYRSKNHSLFSES